MLLQEWLEFSPAANHLESIRRAIRKNEIIVAEANLEVVGFIHFVIHNDIIDGAPNSFITAFYVSPSFRCYGVGSTLLESVITESTKGGVVAIETSTIHGEAKRFYEKRGFKQVFGDIGESFLELDLKV